MIDIGFLKKFILASDGICYICKESSNNKGKYICKDCYGKIELINDKYDKEIDYIDEAYYSCLFIKFNRELVKSYKFHNKSYLYKPIGELMLEVIDKIELSNIDYLIPIPIHRSKRAKRGYNQSELLARYISEEISIPIRNDILIKTKATRPQSSLDLIARLSNLDEAFHIENGRHVVGKNIILVDDILTTGTTLSRTGKILKTSGANEVIALTFILA